MDNIELACLLAKNSRSGGTSGYRTADISLKQAYQLNVVEKEFSVEEIQNV